MEHTERATPQDESGTLDWFRQEPRLPATPHVDADPVHTVWHLSRFRLGGRRCTGRVDNALVCVTRRGTYETFLPPDRPASVRRYVTLYEVDTDPHSFQLNVPLPSLIDSFEFEATADITWRVAHPVRFVRSQERDVPGLLTRELLPVMRDAARRHPQDAEGEAERTVRRAVAEASGIGEEQGLRIGFSVRLRRDATERSHQARLRSARHEAEAARPEHEVTLLREVYEAKRRAGQIEFYESVLARGGAAALALHLAAHPEETRSVLSHLQAGQDKVLSTQMNLINQVLESKRLEDHQLNEPHELIAERMKAILRTEPLAETDTTSPGHPGGAGPGPDA